MFHLKLAPILTVHMKLGKLEIKLVDFQKRNGLLNQTKEKEKLRKQLPFVSEESTLYK